ncbi:TonB-dependent receptor [Variovorax rhizosphaerae]|uniref:TonB-dependent receptor n=1 Tax=Variovorax rhizosphaerae TaxID=1836200 RepID=A0ABU8WH65_9BURK
MARSRRLRVSRSVPSPASTIGAIAREASAFPLGALMLAASVSSWAQSPAPTAAAEPKPAGTLPTITATGSGETDNKNDVQTTKTNIGKGTQEIRDVPQSLTVVTEKLMDDVRMDTLRDALHYTAGITFAATENGTDQDIRLRGFPVATTGDLLIDGMRDPSQYDRDTFNLDRIEVLRGSASMIFGRGSTGGVINQVSKKPLLADQTDLQGTVGSEGYVRGTADFNKRLTETSALRINAMWNTSDNGGAKIDKNGIAPSYSWGIGTRDEFTIGAFHLDVDNIPLSAIRWLPNGRYGVSGFTAAGLPTIGPMSSIADIPPGNFYGTTQDKLKGEANYANAAWNHIFDDGSSLRTQLRSGTFKRQQETTVAGFLATFGQPTTAANLNDFTVLQRAGLTPRKDEYRGTYVQSDYSKEFNWGSTKHSLLAGIDGSKEDTDRYQNNAYLFNNSGRGLALGTRPNTLVGTPDNGAGLTGTGLTPVYRDSSGYSAKSWGVYAQDLVEVAPMWKVLGGVRYDKLTGDFDQYTYTNPSCVNRNTNATIANPTNGCTGGVQLYRPGSPFPVTTTTHLSQGAWSYRAGVLFQPTPTQSYHISYGTSFNSSADTYQYVSPQTANTPPEKSRNFEIGAKLDWLDGKLSTRAAIFKTEKTNERTTDSDFAGSSYLLSGKRHAQGVEIDVVGRLTPQWEVYLSYSYIDEATIDAAGSTVGPGIVGSPVGLTPRHSGAMWVSYQATPKLRFGAGIHGASENRPLQGGSGAASRTASTPGYVVGDVMAEYKFTPDLYAQLNVNNVTNKLYGDQLYPGFVIAGAKRSVLFTVGARF